MKKFGVLRVDKLPARNGGGDLQMGCIVSAVQYVRTLLLVNVLWGTEGLVRVNRPCAKIQCVSKSKEKNRRAPNSSVSYVPYRTSDLPRCVVVKRIPSDWPLRAHLQR